MLSEKSSSPGKSVVNRLISVEELRAVAIKHLVELSVEHEFFCHFFSKRKTCHDGEFSDSFPVTNGVKQGCVLASTLFSMMFSAMLTDAF